MATFASSGGGAFSPWKKAWPGGSGASSNSILIDELANIVLGYDGAAPPESQSQADGLPLPVRLVCRQWADVRNASEGRVRRGFVLDQIAEVDDVALTERHGVQHGDGVGHVTLCVTIAAQADQHDQAHGDTRRLERADGLDRDPRCAGLAHEVQQRIVSTLQPDTHALQPP